MPDQNITRIFTVEPQYSVGDFVVFEQPCSDNLVDDLRTMTWVMIVSQNIHTKGKVFVTKFIRITCLSRFKLLEVITIVQSLAKQIIIPNDTAVHLRSLTYQLTSLRSISFYIVVLYYGTFKTY